MSDRTEKGIFHASFAVRRRKGHDRSPVFLREEDAEAWSTKVGEHEQELKRFLLEARNTPDLEIENFRPMTPVGKSAGSEITAYALVHRIRR